jgi:hypothetical protein
MLKLCRAARPAAASEPLLHPMNAWTALYVSVALLSHN